MLQWAAFFYLSIGYWMLSNKQIFLNVVYMKEYSKEVIRTGHNVSEIQIDQATPVLVVCLIVFAVLLYFFGKQLINSYLYTTTQEEELLGFEGLEKFYKSLYKTDLDYWIMEEVHLRNNLVSHIDLICTGL
jgi:hypothetical protein